MNKKAVLAVLPFLVWSAPALALKRTVVPEFCASDFAAPFMRDELQGQVKNLDLVIPRGALEVRFSMGDFSCLAHAKETNSLKHRRVRREQLVFTTQPHWDLTELAFEDPTLRAITCRLDLSSLTTTVEKVMKSQENSSTRIEFVAEILPNEDCDEIIEASHRHERTKVAERSASDKADPGVETQAPTESSALQAL